MVNMLNCHLECTIRHNIHKSSQVIGVSLLLVGFATLSQEDDTAMGQKIDDTSEIIKLHPTLIPWMVCVPSSSSSKLSWSWKMAMFNS
jgi:hypothetical protein